MAEAFVVYIPFGNPLGGVHRKGDIVMLDRDLYDIDLLVRKGSIKLQGKPMVADADVRVRKVSEVTTLSSTGHIEISVPPTSSEVTTPEVQIEDSEISGVVSRRRRG